jgi:predicted nucleic acid-binding protein
VKIYVDSSILFSLYVTDANSPKADVWRQANAVPLDLTDFHRVELRNAFSLAAFQQRLTVAESQAAWAEIEKDLAAGLLVIKPLPWDKLLAQAEQLALQHTPAIGSRSLDVLHIAAALVLEATDFCTFDSRQASLAKAAGLQVQS